MVKFSRLTYRVALYVLFFYSSIRAALKDVGDKLNHLLVQPDQCVIEINDVRCDAGQNDGTRIATVATARLPSVPENQRIPRIDSSLGICLKAKTRHRYLQKTTSILVIP